MNEWPLIAQLHYVVGVIVVISGFTAMLLEKGSWSHKTAGQVFFYTMLVLCLSGLYLSITRSLQFTFFIAFFSLYLVITGRLALTRWSYKKTFFNKLSFLTAVTIALISFGIATTGWALGLDYPTTEPPYPAYLVFVVFAGISAWSDFQILQQEEIFRHQYSKRHMVRMSAALLIATIIFFQGNGQVLPEIFQHGLILAFPSLAVIGFVLVRLLVLRQHRKSSKFG